MSRICIVGGGFTGLSAALELSAAGLPVTVLEKDGELGGLAGSFRVGNQMLEKFYHHWFTNDQFIMQLVKRLNLEDRIVLRESRTGMYYAHNFFKLSSPLDVLRFTPLSFLNRIRLGVGALRARRVEHWKELEAVTAKDWLIDLFGRKVYEVVWEPLLIGKFGEVFPEISAVWFWNKLKLRGGSRSKRGAEQLAYYRGGFAALATAMAKEIERLGGEIITGADVESLEVCGGRAVRVHSRTATVESRAVILTVPLPPAADLLAPYVPAAYVSKLRRIRYLSNLCLVLELDRSLSNLYWMNVNDPSFPFVGIIEHTNFEPASSYGGRHIVYLSKYLPPEAELYRMTDAEVLDFSVAAIQRMFPAFSRDWVKGYHVWRAGYSQPVIEKNYSSLIPEMRTPLENVFLSTMAQVYPEDRGTNYAVRGGMEVASLLKASNGASHDMRSPRHTHEVLMNTELYKQRLLAKERELEGEIARLKTEAVESRTAEVEDPIDYVNSSTGQSMAREISSIESDTLAAVRDALRRIEEGAYGTCLDCGEQIEQARLDAVPWTPYCLQDQEKHDKAEAISGRGYLEAAS